MANDEFTFEELRKALAKAAATVPSSDPWQEHLGREATAQAVKSVMASEVIQGFSGSWAASYAFSWGAGVSPNAGSEAHQDPTVPKPVRQKTSKLGQPGFPDVDFVPYNWNTNRFSSKGPALIGLPISFDVVGPTLKSEKCDWTWEVREGDGPNGGDYLLMDTNTEGGPAVASTVEAAYRVLPYVLGDGSPTDRNGGLYLVVSNDGSGPGSVPSGATPMSALAGHLDSARYEIFRISAVGVDGPSGRGFVEIHPSKSFSGFFDLPPGSTRHLRAITIIRPQVTRLVAVPGSGPQGREQTFIVVPPEFAMASDLYPPYNGGVAGDGTWLQGGIDPNAPGLSGSVGSYLGKNRLPVPLARRQGRGRIQKSPAAPSDDIGTFVVENVQNGSAADHNLVMRIYHVDSDDGTQLSHGTVASVLGWYQVAATDGSTYTLQRVVEIDPATGQPFFGAGPYHQEPGAPNVNVFFTIHDTIREMHRSSSFDIDAVQASRLDCLIDPRDVERTTKMVSNSSAHPRPAGSSPSRADRAIFNTRFKPGAGLPGVENPGSLLDLGFRMVLYPATVSGPGVAAEVDWNRPIYSHDVTLDPAVAEKQSWKADYSAGVVRLSHPPAPGGDFNPSGTGSDVALDNPRGNLVLYAACVPYSREPGQRGVGVRVVSREDEDVDVFSERIFSVVDGASTPALLGSAPYYDGEVVLTDHLDVPPTGYFDVVDGDSPFFESLGTWGYQSTRIQNFGGGNVTVLEGVYSEPGVSAPDLGIPQTVVLRRDVFFGDRSADNSSVVDDVRFDATYGSALRPSVLRFGNSTLSLQVDGTLLVEVDQAAPPTPSDDVPDYVYGDGFNGDHLIVGAEVTLDADMFYENLTVAPTGILNTAGFRIHVRDTLTNNGIIRNNGSDGGDGQIINPTDGAPSGTLAGGANGGRGENELNGVSGDSSLFSYGGDGGAGGNATGGFAGGSGGTASEPPLDHGKPRSGPQASLGMVIGLGGQEFITGGAGGGGGAGDATGAGGAGGGGGGIVMIAARNLVNEGSIQANGGDGGDGIGNIAVDGAAGGGGGGGGGGAIVISRNLTGGGTITASGGTGGAGDEGGDPGSDGSDGTVILLES